MLRTKTSTTGNCTTPWVSVPFNISCGPRRTCVQGLDVVLPPDQPHSGHRRRRLRVRQHGTVRREAGEVHPSALRRLQPAGAAARAPTTSTGCCRTSSRPASSAVSWRASARETPSLCSARDRSGSWLRTAPSCWGGSGLRRRQGAGLPPAGRQVRRRAHRFLAGKPGRADRRGPRVARWSTETLIQAHGQTGEEFPSWSSTTWSKWVSPAPTCHRARSLRPRPTLTVVLSRPVPPLLPARRGHGWPFQMPSPRQPGGPTRLASAAPGANPMSARCPRESRKPGKTREGDGRQTGWSGGIFGR